MAKRFSATPHRTSSSRTRYSGWGRSSRRLGQRTATNEKALHGVFRTLGCTKQLLLGADRCPSKETLADYRGGKGLPPRGRLSCHGYHRALGPRVWSVGYHHPHRYRSAHQEKTRIQRQKPK